MVLVALPGLAIVRRFFGYEERAAVPRPSPTVHDKAPRTAAIDLAGAAFAVAAAMLLVYLGNVSAEAIGKPTLGIVLTTVYALIIGNFFKPLLRLMAHDFDIGVFFVFLFLVALAAGADVAQMIDTGLLYFAFAMILLTVHSCIIVFASRLFGLDLRSIIIGSTACVGGVTSASAIASAKGWRDLIIPGILAGTLGNAFGTLLGVLVWSMLS